MARQTLSRRWLALGAMAVLGACASPGLRPGPVPGAAKAKAKPAVAAVLPSPTPAPSFPQERPLDEEKPLRVRSRHLRYDHETDSSVFYGGVTVTQDSTTLLARELRSHARGQSATAEGGVLLTDPLRRFQARAGRAEYAGALRSASLQDGLELVSVDPYGVPLTVTGREGSFSDLSRWAQVSGGVTVRRGALSATAGSAEVFDGGGRLAMQGGVRARFGQDQLKAQQAELDQAGKAITLMGAVRAHIVPRDLRQVLAAPWSPGVAVEP